MSRNKFLRAIAALLSYLALIPFSRASAQQQAGREVASLREQLERGLKARFPADFQFIARVVLLVELGRLPEPLVKSTFEWVRRRRWSKTHLVPYFESALRRRAALQGIRI